MLAAVLLLLSFNTAAATAAPDHGGFMRIAWTLYRTESPPPPASRSIVVAVHERGCAGGRNPIPYLQRPEIDYLRKRVVITLWIEKLEGLATCQGNPIGRLRVKLPGPLGARKLYDGSSEPPRRVRPGEEPPRLPAGAASRWR
jgi:hypothetical protein